MKDYPLSAEETTLQLDPETLERYKKYLEEYSGLDLYVSNVLRPSIARYIRSELGPELVEAIEVGSPQYAYYCWNLFTDICNFFRQQDIEPDRELCEAEASRLMLGVIKACIAEFQKEG